MLRADAGAVFSGRAGIRNRTPHRWQAYHLVSDGELAVFILAGNDVHGRGADEFGAEDESNWIGIWRTEEEIKQVVAALRSVFITI